jgi:protein-tyrosine phosphatase
LTDWIVDFKALFLQRARQRNSVLLTQSPEIIAAVLGTRPEYLHAALDTIEQQHGGVQGYATQVLGLEAQVLSQMQQRLLE